MSVEITSQPVLDVAPVDVEHRVGGPVERPGAPQLAVAPGAFRVEIVLPLELGRDAAVEHDAALGRDQLLHPGVGRGEVARVSRQRRFAHQYR